MASSNSANKLLKEMQKIASDAQIQVQKLANQATEKSFKYNTEEANTARAWQTEMSNTAHQREVNDLKVAGLNPVLSANSGAQSYTTSSASAQANDPSASVGALAGQLMQGKIGAYQADTSAAATKAAAAQAASATRYAAAANLAAAREAAAASRYSADKHLEGQKYTADKNYKIAMDKPQTSPFALVDKYFNKILNNSEVQKIVKNASNFKASDFEPRKNGKITSNNFVLDKQGILKTKRGLNQLGIPDTSKNRSLYVKAFLFQDKTAMSNIARQVRSIRNRNLTAANSAANRFNRSGSGVW